MNVYIRAPQGKKTQITFLVTKAKQEKLMISWSDLQRLGILPKNFPEVQNAKAEAKNMENYDTEYDENYDELMWMKKKW